MITKLLNFLKKVFLFQYTEEAKKRGNEIFTVTHLLKVSILIFVSQHTYINTHIIYYVIGTHPYQFNKNNNSKKTFQFCTMMLYLIIQRYQMVCSRIIVCAFGSSIYLNSFLYFFLIFQEDLFYHKM